jgi:hypothetical protein
MKFWVPAVVFVSFLCVNCTAKVGEADIVGTYVSDPAGKPQSEFEKQMELTFDASHEFVIDTRKSAKIEGVWEFDKDKQRVQVTPVDIEIKDPQTGKDFRMSLTKMRVMMKDNSASAKDIADLDEFSQGSSFEPKEGGKKLYEHGEPTLIRKGS